MPEINAQPTWLEKNVCHPAYEALITGLYEPTANAINLLPQAFGGKDWLPKVKIDASQDQPADGGEYLTRLLVHGAIGAFSYATYGRVAGGLLRHGTNKLEGRLAKLIGSESSGQIVGAAIHDGLLDAASGRDRGANVASGVLSFGTFEFLNKSISNKHWITRAIAHAPIGFAGGMTGYISKEAIAGRQLDGDTAFQSAIDGAALNVFLPAMQWSTGRAIDYVKDKTGGSIPLERHANYENLRGKSKTLDSLMNMYPLTRVSRTAEEGACIDHSKNTVHIMPKSPADHLAHELAHKLAVHKFEKDIQYAADLLKYNESFAKATYVEARLKQEQYARQLQLKAAKEILLSENPHAKIPALEPSHMLPIYKRMFEIEFDEQFLPSGGKWRPEEDYLSKNEYRNRFDELSKSGQLLSNKMARKVYDELPNGDEALEQLAEFLDRENISSPMAKFLAMRVHNGSAGYRGSKPEHGEGFTVTKNGKKIPHEYEFSDSRFDKMIEVAVRNENLVRDLNAIEDGLNYGSRDAFDRNILPSFLYMEGMSTSKEARLYAENRDTLNEKGATIWEQVQLAKLAAGSDIPAEQIPALYDQCKTAWSIYYNLPVSIALRLGQMNEYQLASAMKAWSTTIRKFGRLDDFGYPQYSRKTLEDTDFVTSFFKTYEQLSELTRKQQFQIATVGMKKDIHKLNELMTHYYHKDLLSDKQLERLTHQLGWIPPQQHHSLIRGLKTKAFQGALSHLLKERQNDPINYMDNWEDRSALGLALTFGNAWQNWLSMQSKLGRSEHDATYWLPIRGSEHLAGLSRLLEQNRTRPIRQLELVSHHWADLTREIREKSFDEILQHCRPSNYQNVKDNKFAQEAVSWMLPESLYSYWQKVFIDSQNVPSPFPTEKIWHSGKLQGRFLPRSDERGLFLGMYTNCCQHPLGAGSECAQYGQQSPKSGFFVIENAGGDIVAQAWTWLSDKGGICFDNIEAKGLGKQNDSVIDILNKAANDLSKTFTRITLGSDGDLKDLPWMAANGASLKPPSDYIGYRDSYNQVIISDKPRLENQD